MYLVSTAVCTCVSFSMCACFQKLGSDWQKHMTIMCVLCTHLWIILCIWPLKEEYHSHLKMHGKGRHNNAMMQHHKLWGQSEEWRPFVMILYHFMKVVCQWWSRRWIQGCPVWPTHQWRSHSLKSLYRQLIICGPAMPLELRQFAVQFRLFLARLMCERQACRLRWPRG